MANVGEGVGAFSEGEREPHPSDSLRTFGAVVQALREYAGLSRVEFGERVRFSKLGRAAPYLSRGEVGLAAWFREWARLERTAVSLCTYECRLVPGLLQSEAYARAVFEGTIPVVTDERLEALLAARAERQRMLVERPTMLFSFIVEEHVFRRRFGDAEAARGLLDHVLAAAAPRNVTLQVVPLGGGLHACLDGPVQVLETPEGRRLGYAEGQESGRLISDPKGVSLLCQRYETLRSQALNPQESRALLERLRGEQ
ncbi:DUF5753 domain-containing protein [Streptomyces decoyicus]|uniref:DUF5753 domain-containing protein n=1 Tax=Streptomyces decoyicus TaxID=249567 RepID=UPI003653159E